MITITDRRRLRLRSLAVLAALGVAAGIAGCGDTPDNDTDKASATSVPYGPSDPPPQRPGPEWIDYKRALELADLDNDILGSGRTDRSQIREVLEDVQVSIAEGHGPSVCNELSKGAIRNVVRSARLSNPDACEQVIARRTMRRRKAHERTALSRLLSVDVDGNKAMALVKYPDGSIRHVPFVNEEGLVWRASRLDLIDRGIQLTPASERRVPEGGPPPRPAFSGGPVPDIDNGDPKGGPRVKIREVVDDIQHDFYISPGGVCPELSEDAQIELAGVPTFGACTGAVTRLSRRIHAAGTPLWHSRIVSIDIDGNRASAVLATRQLGRHRAAFLRDPARGWKLKTLRHVEPVGPLLDR